MRRIGIDLYRYFGIGFAIGAAMVAFQTGVAHWDSLAPAIAAIVPQ